MVRLKCCIALACLVAVPVVASAAAVDEPPASDHVAGLVRQLGSASFSERERATRELVGLGISTREALRAAATEPDAEVRSRARAILAIVSGTDFQARLSAFAADQDGSLKQSMPGWDRFVAHLGNSQLARRLFVEMQRAEPELLEAYAQGGKTATDALDSRCRTLMQQLSQASNGDGGVQLGTLATLLLVGSSEDVTIDEQLAFQLYTWMIYRPAFQKNANGGTWAAMLRKLLGLWIVKDPSPSATPQNLMFAASYELKQEGLTLASRLLASDGTTGQARQYALLTMGRFGGREHLPAVEKYLTDATNCGAFGAVRPQRQIDVQIRDIALSVLLHVTGQSARDYGAVVVQPSPQSYFQVPTVAFANGEARDAAIKRWQDWRAQHLQP